MVTKFFTRSQLVADFRRIGLRPGDTVMLHASVKAVGWIVGGPRIVLDALLDVLTPHGTLMMLAGWEGNPYDMRELSSAEQQYWLDECPPFDPQSSPADFREMSILAEYLRIWPGACRSSHPMSSFVAVGKRAEWLTQHHDLSYGWGDESPLARLCEADGRVLVLGAPLSTLTLLHHAEQIVDLPNKAVDRYKMPILKYGRKVWVEIEEYDTTNGIVDFGIDDYFREIGLSYLRVGRGDTGTVGSARTHLFNACDLKEYAVEWMKQHYKSDSAFA